MAYRTKTLAVLAAVLAATVLASPAHARTFTVDSVTDVGDDNTGDGVCSTSFGCTVRAAIEEANAFTLDASDTIVIPAGTYDLTETALTPSSDMQITGASPRTTVVNQAGGADRVFDIFQGGEFAPTVGISGLTLSNGVANSDNGFFGGNLRAAGSVVTLTDLTVTGGSASSGGGLTNDRGTMTVRTSTITGNAADTGGGDSGAIQNFSDVETRANLTVENSTITGNTARLGPGIFSEGGNNEVTVANSTIVDNDPTGDPRLDKPNGGGLTILDGDATVTGSIIARNSSPDSGTPNCASDPAGDFGALAGTIDSTGGNVENATDCGFTSSGDLQSTSPNLGGLANNGGPTDTHKLPATSPARDIIPAGAANCPPTDQRGVSRRGPCDSGAYEFEDLIAPNTTITSGPSNPTADSTPTFAFTSSESGSRFQCRVDSVAFAACTSPHTTAVLANGAHTFEVRAIDRAGNIDGSPARRTFTVDTSRPNTSINSGPAGLTRDNTPTFTFSSTESGSTFECRVDGAAFATCSSPRTTAALADGAHTFAVRAIDRAGNIDGSPARRTFTVDTSRPDTSINSGPAGPTSDNTPTFAFTSTESGSSFRCRVDSAAFAPCTSPQTTAALADGAHTFEARAADPAENDDPSPASRSFTVDTSPPETTITAGPSGVIDDPTPTFRFASAEPGVAFQCRVDGAAFAPCISPHTTAALAEGAHTFEVRAIDAAGNVDPSPASTFGADAVRTFTVRGALPPPVIGRTFNVEPVKGEVFVSLPAAGARASAAVPGLKGRRFIPLSEARQVPMRSLLDTRKGTVRVVSAQNRAGKTQAGKFSAGVFQVLQSRDRDAKGLTELRLKGSSFNRCKTARSGTRGAGPRARTAAGRRIRRLRGSGSGRFRTRGRRSAATVRGTIWTVTDRCDGTLTTVKRGKVAVRDFGRKKTIIVKAGKSYLAKAPR